MSARSKHSAAPQNYWRSIEELSASPEAQAWLETEFGPRGADLPGPVSRRSFLRLMAATLAMAGAGCTKPHMREIVPYVRQPEEIVLGEPLYYATAMNLGGFGTGLLVKSREGRPIKADGNTLHPASLGGSSVWMQACLLDLYNPDRAQAITHDGDPSSFSLFLGQMNSILEDQRRRRGSGLRFLTGCVTSPTLAAQLTDLLNEYPEARWHQWEPVNRDNALLGARSAFGQDLATHFRFERAKVIFAADSDFLQIPPDRLRYARDFADGRRVSHRGPNMNRLYAMESTPTLAGSMADHRLPVSSRQLENALVWLGHAFGVDSGLPSTEPDAGLRQWLEALARDLHDNPGASIVTVGDFQPAHLHDLAHRVNHALGNSGATVFYTQSAEARPALHLHSLRELAQDLDDGKVDLLLILGGNPAYDAPVDLDFASALPRAKHSVHLSLSFNETSARCQWQLPAAHFLECWSDIRSFDGTVTIQQPLIAPLFGGYSEHELLWTLRRTQQLAGYEIIRDYWRKQNRWSDFEQGWRKAVQDGVIEGTALPEVTPSLRPPARNETSAPAESPGELEVLFRPDSSVWDGRFADNPWLQEIPRPFSSITWDNAILISPKAAGRQGLSNGDVIELRLGNRFIRGAVWLLPGQAENTVTLHLGYGRDHGGRGGIEVGFNAYFLRSSTSLWKASGASISRANERYEFAATQLHHRLHSDERQVYREGSLRQFQDDPQFVKKSVDAPDATDTIYNANQYNAPLKWGMSIDLTTCIGCNACSMACNFENNIPVVGPAQVALGREMLWIRVDTYFRGSLDNPDFCYQPVPCMQCENAPCEYVCPVGATVHSDEGLNLQIYNRCVGTRYCSNNCPYKVRRFNFFGYDAQTPPLQALRTNPEVTVRARGVMEKCTYCLQRIAAARIQAEEANRPIGVGQVRTACQEACPTQAIVFGIMTNPEDPVAKLKAHPLDFPMLGELNTRPRTTYLAKLRNPNPAIGNEPHTGDET